VTGSEDHIGEYRAFKKDGSVVLVEARGRSIWQVGRLVRVTAIRDITERKRTEEALRQQSEELKTAWDQAENEKRRLP
jgi:PAS domain S-box-containing protein